MKYTLIILLLIGFGLVSCGTGDMNSKRDSILTSFKIIELDGCQYYYSDNFSSAGGDNVTLTHKANCNNPIHDWNKSNALPSYIIDTIYPNKIDTVHPKMIIGTKTYYK